MLLDKGVIDPEDAICMFCKSFTESCFHLFFECSFAWEIWMKLCKVWGISWVFPGNVRGAFISWYDARIKKNLQCAWRMLFSACIWSIWLSRNALVFEGKVENADRVGDLTLLRVAQWFKAKFSHCHCPTWQAVNDPKLLITLTKLKLKEKTSWQKPEIGHVKFNVDAAQSVINGRVGIGGILRDADGRTKMIFSKSLTSMKIENAEFLAILEALRIFDAFHQALGNVLLIIESDSLIACNWCNDSNNIPWSLCDQAEELKTLKTRLQGTKIQKIPRDINPIADNLAKAGIDRTNPLEAFL